MHVVVFQTSMSVDAKSKEWRDAVALKAFYTSETQRYNTDHANNLSVEKK